ncbi:MAG: hypothetical protein HY985_16010 [Magnetospirillum sp.]|nr:hypothetical protein [Magnetospirillum sp.]
MSNWQKFFLGGLGALLPMIITIAFVDNENVSKFLGRISTNDIDDMKDILGFTIRIPAIFIVGGLWVIMNSLQKNEVGKAIQLGIVAPASVLALVNGTKPVDPPHESAYRHSYLATASFQIASLDDSVVMQSQTVGPDPKSWDCVWIGIRGGRCK